MAKHDRIAAIEARMDELLTAVQQIEKNQAPLIEVHNRMVWAQQQEAQERQNVAVRAQKMTDDKQVGAANAFTTGYVNTRVEVTKQILGVAVLVTGGMVYKELGALQGTPLLSWTVSMACLSLTIGICLWLFIRYPELLGRQIRFMNADAAITKDAVDRHDKVNQWLSTASIWLLGFGIMSAAFFFYQHNLTIPPHAA